MTTRQPLRLDRSLLKPGDRACVAVSGGADSVALLLALTVANASARNALGVGLSAVHVHHHLRGEEADGDAAFVQDLCKRLDLPLHLHHIDVAQRVATTGETTEEAARELRYEVLRSLLASGEADAVLTAHTIEDQAETVLMKLLRGAWTAGLSGIAPQLQVPGSPGRPSGRILRPLLATHRAEIEAFLQALGQPWREDSSNADLAFTRNRLRHRILPELRTFNPSLDETLADLAQLAREDEARWQEELSRLLPHLLLPGKPVRGGGRAVATPPHATSLSIEVERLRPLDQALRRRILRGAAERLGCSLSFEETHRLLALCGFAEHAIVTPRSGARLDLSHQLRAERSPRELRLSRIPPRADHPHDMAR